MGKAIPEQHPAVVLRSHYIHLRALLVAAIIAVVGLTATVVIVANDSDQIVSTSVPRPAVIESTPAVPDTAPLPQRRLDGAVDVTPAPRYDGGPEEGSADIAPTTNAPARPNQAQAFPGQAQQAGETSTKPGLTMSPPVGASAVESQSVEQSVSPRYDGGPNEGSADVTTHSGGKAPVMPQTQGFRYDGGPEEGTRGPGN